MDQHVSVPETLNSTLSMWGASHIDLKSLENGLAHPGAEYLRVYKHSLLQSQIGSTSLTSSRQPSGKCSSTLLQQPLCGLPCEAILRE